MSVADFPPHRQLFSGTGGCNGDQPPKVPISGGRHEVQEVPADQVHCGQCSADPATVRTCCPAGHAAGQHDHAGVSTTQAHQPATQKLLAVSCNPDLSSPGLHPGLLHRSELSDQET